MGVRNYLIDGISGVGKTAVAEELERRGYHVIHGDRVLGYFGDPETGEALARPDHNCEAETAVWLYKHWIWPVDIVEYLITSTSHSQTFFCGGSRNTSQFIHLFDKVVVLHVGLETLKQRLATRPEGEFGGRHVEKDLIVRLHAFPEQHSTKAMMISADAPVSYVVDRILAEVNA